LYFNLALSVSTFINLGASRIPIVANLQAYTLIAGEEIWGNIKHNMSGNTYLYPLLFAVE
jgi:hypothetical protein